jgi:hypothetical protein
MRAGKACTFPLVIDSDEEDEVESHDNMDVEGQDNAAGLVFLFFGCLADWD